MKVLLVHEYYRSSAPSGENTVFERELELLQNKGLEVGTLVFRNDLIGSCGGPSVIKTALYTPWSPLGAKLVEKAVQDFHPDVVHFHNIFPVLSPSAVIQARRMGVATVLSLHNFRLFCARAMMVRKGAICEQCLGRYPWPALLHGCYRNSRFATLPLFLNIFFHQLLGTWQQRVDRFIVLSEFNRRKFIRAGLPADRLMVKPNFFSGPLRQAAEKSKDVWLFVGRLELVKGVHLLPDLWHLLGDRAPELHILGDGPLYGKIRQRIGELGLGHRIVLHGKCPAAFVQKMFAKARLLLFPSLGYEGFPLVIGEAFAAGVPVAVARLGTPASIVQDGVTGIHFNPGDLQDMAGRLKKLLDDPDMLAAMGENARAEYEQRYTPDANFRVLMNIYSQAISRRRGAGCSVGSAHELDD